MNKVFTAITFSLGALLATSSMAASYDHDRYQNDRHGQNPGWNSDRYNDRHDHYDNKDRYNQQYARYHSHVNPSREWRSGQIFPSQLNSSRYAVSHKSHRDLYKPGKYQQWYKVNGDYVLVNERSNRIIRIMG